ncbi:MAG: flagellar export protein FliJ [Defluviitaleaceae bacterium]|nr:flagellar export protein FliJ [Defluviitaleaceae bacterium]
MSKFKFKMESVLNLKERIAEQKEQEFGKAMQALAKEKTILENYYTDRKNAISQLKSEMESSNLKPIDFQILSNYIESTKVKIVNQEKLIKKAEQFVEFKRRELVEATKEKKMMEKLKENEFEEYIDETKKKEQKTVDEIVSFRFKPIITVVNI